MDGQIWGLRKASDVSMANNKTHSKPKAGDAAKAKVEAPRAQPTKAQLNGTPPPASVTQGADMAQGGLGNILKGSPFVDTSLPPKSYDQDSRPKPPAFIKAAAANKTNGTTAIPSKVNGKAVANPKSVVEKVKESVQANRNQPPPKEKLVTTKEGRAIKPPPTRQKPPAKPGIKPPSPKVVKTSSPVEEKSTVKTTAAKQPPVEITAASEPAQPAQPAGPTKATAAPTPAEPPAVEESTAPEPSEPTPQPEQTQPDPQPPSTNPQAPKTAASRAKTPTTTSTNRRLSSKPTTTTSTTTRALPTLSSSTTTRPPPSALGRSSTVSKRPGPPPTKTSTQPAKRLPRASLPAQLTPKPSTTMSGRATTAKAPSEGFLARMMRPTASSAQKTHEKVGGGSPPRGGRAASTVPLQEE